MNLVESPRSIEKLRHDFNQLDIDFDAAIEALELLALQPGCWCLDPPGKFETHTEGCLAARQVCGFHGGK